MAVSVLMVCLGNICRSPLAEATLRHHAVRLGLDVIVDSAGTGDWHVGHPPDMRAQEVARRLGGIDVSALRARQVILDDFHCFDHIIAMDHDNHRMLLNLPNVKDLHTSFSLGEVKASSSLPLTHLLKASKP